MSTKPYQSEDVMDCAILSPSDSIIIDVLVKSFTRPIKPVSKPVADTLQQRLKDHLCFTDGVARKLMFPVLIPSCRVLYHMVDDDSLSSSKFVHNSQFLIGQHLFEKATDDINVLDERGDLFLNKFITQCFNSAAVKVINDDMPGALAELEALPDMSSFFQTETGDALLKIFEAEGYPSNDSFFPDVTRSIFFVHLHSLHQVKQKLDKIGARNPNLFHLHDVAVNQIKDRYLTINQLLEQPNVDVETALRYGEMTVLTTPFLTSFALFLADDYDHIGVAIESNQQLVIDAARNFSTMERIINDIGGFSSHADELITAVLKLRRDYKACTPRQFFQQVQLDEVKLVGMLGTMLGDAREGEYNIALNAGIDNTMSIDEQWDQFVKNIRFLNGRYKQAGRELKRQLGTLQTCVPYVGDMIGSWLYFNYLLYTGGGDYDTAVTDGVVKESANWVTLFEKF